MTPQNKIRYGKVMRFLKMALQGLQRIEGNTIAFENDILRTLEKIEYHLATKGGPDE